MNQKRTRLAMRAMAVVTAIHGLIGFPLTAFVAADGHPWLAFGVYLFAALMLALAALMWILSSMFKNGIEPQAALADSGGDHT